MSRLASDAEHVGWVVETTDDAGTDVTADVLVGADIPGIETLAGTLFHSAAWDHVRDLAGR